MASSALYPLAKSRIAVGGTAVVSMFGPLLGGVVANPSSPADQGVAEPESIFVDYSGATAGLAASATTFEVPPGWSLSVPDDLAVNVSINAATTGHRFSGYVVQVAPPYPPAPVGPFPPDGSTSLLGIIPSYLYWQYRDDEDLEAMRAAYNRYAQDYADWFNAIELPIYTSPTISGNLLDLVAEGLYGIKRPTLSAGPAQIVGPFNTFVVDGAPFNYYAQVGGGDVFATSDDTFKRIITWAFWKGDGKTFTVRWLKRRIARFLTGVDGTAGTTDETYDVSVTFGSGVDVNIGVGVYAPVLKEAIDSGALELPPGFNFIVTIA